ncbi:bifunctional oligoribonuclease/PAP phosphatase NrnA [Myxococcota bacterium]|nr:bifunctional oligoribonuclease/PAP phosphatase NrnA [Myxococcota bacterium]
MVSPDLEACIERARPKLGQLRELAQGKKTLLAQTHDYPDPDTIASALALTWLLQELEGLEPDIGYGGIIGRAENKAMIKVLGIKMRRTTPADFDKYDLVALLDTQPEVGNHSVPLTRMPDIVFDHHFRRELEGPEPAYFDVGGSYGATSTKVLELVLASGLTPPTHIATALFYGVKSDTRNLARQASSADLTAYLYLLPLVDTVLLSEIEHPQVPLDYFRVFNKAIMRAKIYGNMLVADLGSVYTPDLCAEVADRMLAVEGMKHAVVTGWYEESLFLSLRTRSRSKNAGRILHSIVTSLDLGTAGGHGPMAGARISVEGKSQRARTDVRRKVISRLVAAFGQDYRHFTRILSPKDALDGDEPPPPRALKEPAKPAKERRTGSRREDVATLAAARDDARKEEAAN